jgi:cytochrome b
MYHSGNLKKVRVWDLPTRVFHWALVLCTLGLTISGTVGGNALVWHMRLGHMVLALLLFRIVWGLVGGRWSRFGAFVYAPQSVINYIKGKGQPMHSVGHSPIGAGSVFAMLAVLLAQVGTGLLSDDEIAFSGPLTRFVSNATVSLATNYHANVGKWLLLALVSLHVAAIFFYLRRKRNLVAAMLHGDKELLVAAPASRDDMVSRVAALLTLSACAALAYWVSTLAMSGG